MSKLQTIDADTLLSTPLPATRFVVDRLLPEGLHILAGAPKIGKSWLALWLCLCVAKGDSVWDFAVTKGTVLYLCLEDSLTRIQNRLFQITEDAPDTLHFATLAGSIGGGLEDQLKSFLAEHPGTALVVIDTLQTVADIVGHADTGFLERTYCHPQKEQKEQAADTMLTMLRPNGESIFNLAAGCSKARHSA